MTKIAEKMVVKHQTSLISTTGQGRHAPENHTHFLFFLFSFFSTPTFYFKSKRAKLTHPWGAWLMAVLVWYRSIKPHYFITTAAPSGWRCHAYSSVPPKRRGHWKRTQQLQTVSYTRSEVLTASSTSMHKCVPGSAVFSSPFIFCSSLYRVLRFLYASLQFLHTSE